MCSAAIWVPSSMRHPGRSSTLDTPVVSLAEIEDPETRPSDRARTERTKRNCIISKVMAVFGLKEKSQTGDPVMHPRPCALATPQGAVHVWEVTGPEPMTDLTGRLLIAMPGMPDPRFEHSLIYVCAHSEDGSMGLIVNKPSADVSFQALIDQLSIENTADLTGINVHFGGPVELGRGFVLHSTDFESEMTTLFVDDDFAMTATLDVHIERCGHGKIVIDEKCCHLGLEIRRMQDKPATKLHRAAKMHVDACQIRGVLDRQLVDQRLKTHIGRGFVHNEPHRSILGMGADIDQAMLEPRVGHPGHRDQQATCQVGHGFGSSHLPNMDSPLRGCKGTRAGMHHWIACL